MIDKGKMRELVLVYLREHYSDATYGGLLSYLSQNLPGKPTTQILREDLRREAEISALPTSQKLRPVDCGELAGFLGLSPDALTPLTNQRQIRISEDNQKMLTDRLSSIIAEDPFRAYLFITAVCEALVHPKTLTDTTGTGHKIPHMTAPALGVLDRYIKENSTKLSEKALKNLEYLRSELIKSYIGDSMASAMLQGYLLYALSAKPAPRSMKEVSSRMEMFDGSLVNPDKMAQALGIDKTDALNLKSKSNEEIRANLPALIRRITGHLRDVKTFIEEVPQAAAGAAETPQEPAKPLLVQKHATDDLLEAKLVSLFEAMCKLEAEDMALVSKQNSLARKKGHVARSEKRKSAKSENLQP